MTVLTKLPYNKEYVTQFSQENNEPEWMKELRLQALDQVESLDMPEPDKTNINRWNFSEFKHTVEADKISSLQDLPEEIQGLFDEDDLPENTVVLRNQTAAYSQLSEDLQNKGVIFTDLFTAMQEHEDLVKRYYMQDAVSIDEHRLTALHAALMNGGIFVYVPKNVQVEEPLQAVFWQEDAEAALFNHVLVVAEENSKLTYVENYTSHNEDVETFSNIITEVIAHDNAKVSYGAVDNFASGMTTYINRKSTRLNSSHVAISYAVFCLKKKKQRTPVEDMTT